MRKFLLSILVLCLICTGMLLGLNMSITRVDAHSTIADVMAYGATGDGATDDASAIQSAINAVSTNC